MLRCAYCFLFILLIASFCVAQAPVDVEKNLKSKLEGKTVLIRGFYDSAEQHYDPNGQLLGEAPTGPWTLFGYIHVTKIDLAPTLLTIEGQRISIRFKGNSDKARVAQELATKDRVLIHIDVPDLSESAIATTLASVFLGSSEQLVDIAPAFWQRVLRGADFVEPKETISGVAVNKIGGGVRAPRTLLDPEPGYTAEAKRARFEGTVVLSGIVDTDGWMKQVQIMRPVGLGLDEKAITTAQTWRFEPATRKSKPVPVRIAVEVNFHLY